jgi:flagellar protein FlgJ
MAFNPRSDVILEVLNAADPARASLAAERLSALAGSNAPAGDFAADLEKAASSAPQAGLAAEGLADARSRLAAIAEGPDKASRAKVEFEATLINSFIAELLPKDAGSVFGEGSAGDMWRSMLSEQVSQQIAKSGALGLRRLFATHDLVPARHGEATTAAADAAQMSANILSAPSAATLVDGAVLVAGRKRG